MGELLVNIEKARNVKGSREAVDLILGDDGIWQRRREGGGLEVAKGVVIRAHDRWILRWSVVFARRLAGIFRLQHENTLRILGRHVLKRGKIRKDEMSFDLFFEGMQWDEMMIEGMSPVSMEIMLASGERGLRQMGDMGGSWLQHNYRAKEWLMLKEFKFAGHVNGTTKRELAKTLAEGYARGETYREMSGRVSHVFEGATRGTGYRAMRIARTEVNSVSNYGLLEGFKEAGVDRKEWLSAVDARPHHLEASGQQVHVDQPFVVMGEELMHPGDMAGSGANVINCRCVAKPVV